MTTRRKEAAVQFRQAAFTLIELLTVVAVIGVLRLGMNLYLGNLLVIGLVTLWNFWLNARFNWRLAAPGPTP